MSLPWLHVDHIGREVRRPGDRYWLDLSRRSKPVGGFVQMVLDGCLSVEFQGRRLPVPAGSALLLHSGMAAHYGLPPNASEPARFEWVYIAGAGVCDLFADLVARLGPVLPDRDGTLLGQMRTLGLAAAPDRRTDPLEVAARVHAFLIELARRETGGGAATAVARLRADPLRRWDLGVVAREAGCSRDHLGRLFRAATGEALATWLLCQRLEAADRLLAGTRMSAVAVAHQTGFPSAQAMARALRMRHGSGPRAHRRISYRRPASP
jgi:AraC-like DNA-binding protein